MRPCVRVCVCSQHLQATPGQSAAAAAKAAADKAAADKAAADKAAADKAAADKAAAEKAAAEKAAAETAAAELKHWKMELDKMTNARAQLRTAQGRVRLESLRELTQARNAARVALVHALDDALRVHDERHAEEQRRSLTVEAAALQQQQGARKLTLAEQLRLECLHSQVLPVLDEWVAQIGRVREEREDLGRHVICT